MASNDMNSWDEDPHKLLRQRLQEAFDEYKVPASSSLRHRVFDPLQAARRRRRVYRVVGAVMLLLLVGGILYQSPRVDHLAVDSRTMTTASPRTPLHAQPARTAHPSTPSVGRSIGIESAGVDSVAGGGLAPSSTVSRATALARLGTPAQSSSTSQELFAAYWRKKKQVSGRSADERSVKSARFGYSRSIRPDANPIKTDGHELTLNPSAGPADAFGLSAQPLTETAPVAYHLLKPLGISLFRGQLPVLPSQLSALRLEGHYSTRKAVAPWVRHWFVEAEPLSSFQWMSAPPSSTVYLSNVSAPAAFSPATWGYQLNGGFRFQHWQAYLSLGQLRRWAYYTVNKNHYWLDPSTANPYQLERETNTVAENVALPMVGVGLSQLRSLSQGRYVLELGGQLSYLPTSGQGLIRARGGIGRRLLLNQQTDLQIGLTVDYGLTRLLSEQQQLTIHPFVVGIGLRIQPRSE